MKETSANLQDVGDYKIEICNMRTQRFSYQPWMFKVDRTSPVGNPFYMRDESQRDEVCDKYEAYFYKQLDYNSEFAMYLRKMLSALKQYGRIQLYCWCAPKRCHAETIKAWLEQQIQSI